MRTGPVMTVVDRETFLALRRALRATTKVCLRETFGISETTWVKLRDGRPIKASTLERILERHQRLCGRAAVRGAPFDAALASPSTGLGYLVGDLGRTSTMEPSGA